VLLVSACRVLSSTEDRHVQVPGQRPGLTDPDLLNTDDLTVDFARGSAPARPEYPKGPQYAYHGGQRGRRAERRANKAAEMSGSVVDAAR